MVHKGEIIKEAIEKSGTKKTRIADEMGISRGTLYNIFNQMEVDDDIILKIGAIIHHDFSENFPKMRTHKVEETPEEYLVTNINELRKEVDYWRGKYIALLEEHNKLLKK